MKLRPQAWMTLVLFITAAVGEPVASAGTFPGANGKIAFFDVSLEDIVVVNADGTGRVKLTDSSTFKDHAPAWSADATKLAFVRAGVEVWVMNATGSGKTKILAGDPNVNEDGIDTVSWSPDGASIAFDRGTGRASGQDTRIFKMSASGAGVTQLTQSESSDPAWSPDGSKIVFRSPEGLAVMGADGSNQTLLGDDPRASVPNWSPDGAKIAFSSQDFGDQVFVMNADGSGVTQLTTGENGGNHPSFAPDGTKIAFDHDFDIWVMNPDGSGAVNVTSTPGTSERDPDWGTGGPAPPSEGIEFSADAYEVDEGDGNAPGASTVRGAVITVVRTSSTAGTATMLFATSDGSATSSVSRKCRTCTVSEPDFLEASGTLVFGDGQTSKTFTVPIVDDGRVEGDETVNLTLKRVTRGALPGPRSTAVLTIHDNDPNISFARAVSSGSEEAGSPRLSVLLSAPVRAAVDYSVTGGTATSGEDFTLAAGTLGFGARSPSIPLRVIDDDHKEESETVVVELSNPANAELGRTTTHTYTIKDNDPQGDVAGDTPGSALAVDLVTQPRQVIRENLAPANRDVDVYSVHLEAGDDLAIDVDPAPAFDFTGAVIPGLLSGTLRILGPDGTTELAVVGGSEEPDGSGSTDNPAHLFRAETAGDYYLSLSSRQSGELRGYRIELHRLALAEGFQAPAVLDKKGPMFAWLRGDTLGIAGPTGYGFALQGSWTPATTFNKRARTWSAVYTLAAGEEVDLVTVFGDLRLQALADIVVATGPNRWGDSFGEVTPAQVSLRMGIPLDALADALRDEFGLEFAVSALERWTILMGSKIMEGGRDPDGRSLPSGVEQLMPGIPYLLFDDKPTIAAIFGDVRIEQEALDQKLLLILDPTDPFLYIRGEEAGELKQPTLAFSRRGYIPFQSDLPPTLPTAVGLTDFSSHVFASAGAPPNPALAEYITIFADQSVDLDANDDGTWLAGEGNAHELSSGDLSAIGEVLRDINLGVNGRVIFHYNSSEFDFETPLGRATAVYNGPEEAFWFRGRQGPESSPLDGTPFSFLNLSQENFFEGTIHSDGTFSVIGGTRYVANAAKFEIELHLANDGIGADVEGSVELKGTGKVNGVEVGCTATGDARGLFSFSYSNRLHMSGSLKVKGKVKCKVGGEKVTIASFDLGGSFDDGKIEFRFPVIGKKSIRLF